MNQKIERVIVDLLQILVVCAFAFGIAWGGLNALDAQAEIDEQYAQIERLRHANECNAMVGAHRRECLKDAEVAE